MQLIRGSMRVSRSVAPAARPVDAATPPLRAADSGDPRWSLNRFLSRCHLWADDFRVRPPLGGRYYSNFVVIALNQW